MFQKITQLIAQHKRAAVIVGLILAVGGYITYGKIKSSQVTTKYVLAQVQKGTVIAAVSGSGQASVTNQVDIKGKVSGDVIYDAGIKSGQEVKDGTLLIKLDTRDQEKVVRDAEANLLSAKIALEKLIQPADQLSVLQAENSLAQAEETKQKAVDDLSKSYDDGFNTVANAFLDLPGIISGLHDILFSSNFGNNQWNMDYYTDSVKQYDETVVKYRQDAFDAYQTARAAYDVNFSHYKSASRSSDSDTIDAIIKETYTTTKDIAGAVKNAGNLIQFYEDRLIAQSLKPNALADTHLATLNTETSKTNSHLLNLLSIENTIQTDRESIIDATRSIGEKTESLAKLKAGAEALDIESQKLTIQQRENALLDAKEKLNDSYIVAPFSGVIAKLNVKKGDQFSAGTVAATIITKQRTAEVTLNEVDVAKIKLGQKSTLTFDAVPELTISGEVSEIDTIGTTSQGVVSYLVKIIFDTQDERVKPGMSLSASIITDAKPNVLIVPNGAIKSQGNNYYVEVADKADNPQASVGNLGGVILAHPLNRKTVQIGLANDDVTEIISGLEDGDVVVERTITITSQSAQPTSAGSGLRLPGLPGGNRAGGNRG